MDSKQSTEFFAAADASEISGLLNERVTDWIKFTQATSTYQRMRESWKMYYGLSKEGINSSSSIREAGPRGEYSLLTCNDFRNILQHLLVMTTSQRPALECRAANTDSESQQQCILGNALLDWYMREKKVERYLKNNVEYGLFLSEGFMSMDWEPTMGQMYQVNPQTGMPVYEGDIAFQNYTPLDVIRDPFRNDVLLPWAMVVRWKNRWNLAAKYPEKADQILSIKPEMLWRLRDDFFNRVAFTDNDLIPEITFYHEPCEALPQGRLVRFLDSDTLLIDSPLPYSKVPVFRTAPADQANTPYGYSPAFDLMGPQQALNLLDSCILTNQKTFGVGVIIGPEGANLDFTQLADGLSFIQVNEKNGALRPMNFTQTPAEVFTYRNLLKEDMQNLSAVNSVIRGNPTAQITSGSFAALIASQAIQFNSGLEMSYAQTCEDVGGMIIEMLQKFATTKRVAKISGQTNQFMLKSFSNADIASIKTVIVDLANPLTKTTAGRMKMAEDLGNLGLIKRPEQYLMVMETGKLDPEIENERTSLLNIRKENELLRKGGNPSILLTDDHHSHVLEHMSVLDDPDARDNPTIAGAVTDHVKTHIQQWSSLDPNFVQALGRVPLVLNRVPGMPPGLISNPDDPTGGVSQPAPVPPGPQGMPQGPQSQGPGPAAGQPNSIGQLKNSAAAPQMPRPPNMPTNPLTHEKFTPIQGPVSQITQNIK